MIDLEVHEARTFFSGPEPELEVMFHRLRVKNKNAYWAAKAALRRMTFIYHLSEEKKEEKIAEVQESTKYIKFYERRSDSFASGLLSRVRHFLERKGIRYKVHSRRKAIRTSGDRFKKIHFRDKIEVRGEQLEAIKAALTRGRGILHCATNFGKTEVACAIISEYIVQTGDVPRVLFIIHRAALAQQTKKRFRKHLGDPKTMEGIKIGKDEIVVPVNMIGAGKKRIPKSGVLVATTQTAGKFVQAKQQDFLRFTEDADIFFIDEFHINKAWQATKISNCCSAPMRFGLSGTIDKKDKVKMLHYMGMTGRIIAEVRNKELVDLGRSARPHIRLVEIKTHKIDGVRYAAAYRSGVVKSEKRNQLVVSETLRYANRDWRTLVTVSRIAHGFKLKSMLEHEVDIPVEFIHGSTPLEIRDKVIKRFEKGKVPILIASPIFDVGMDVPEIEAWVNAAGGLGWELVIQRLGRVLRRKEGENRVRVTDFIDKHNRYLMKHSLARMRHYISEEIATFEILKGDK